MKVSMSEISPLPKYTKERLRKRAPQKSQVLSSSPCKRNFEEKVRRKNKDTERLKSINFRRRTIVAGRVTRNGCVLAEKKVTTKNGFSAACAHLGGMECVPIMQATEHLYVIIVKDLPSSFIITDSLFKR
jgi:hypothetical protein